MAMVTSLDGFMHSLALLGLLYLTVLASKAVAALRSFFFRGGKRLRDFGEWAVVTGATDGIGKAYAFELARQGMNVLVISRTEAKLQEIEQEIQQRYPKVEVSHLAIDYSNFDGKERDAVKAKISGLDVGVLINNVGMSYPFTKYFHELKDEEIAGLVEMNVNSTVG